MKNGMLPNPNTNRKRERPFSLFASIEIPNSNKAAITSKTTTTISEIVTAILTKTFDTVASITSQM